MRAELQIQTLPLTAVEHHPENPRYHSRKQIEEIAASISDHGYAAGSMTVQQSTMYLAKGNGVYDALTMLGYTEADFVVVDMSDAEAMQFMIRDNRLSDMSSWLKPELDALMAELKETGLQLQDMGFDETALEVALVSLSTNDPSPAIQQSTTCPSCGCEF